MENEKTKPNLSVAVTVKAVNYQNGNVMESSGKITKTGPDHVNVAEEDTLTFRASDCTKSSMEVNYNSSTTGTGEQATDVELDIKGGILNEKKEVVDVIATDAKLKVVFGGKGQIEKTEDWLKLKIENSCDAKCATTDSYYTTKTTEIK